MSHDERRDDNGRRGMEDRRQDGSSMISAYVDHSDSERRSSTERRNDSERRESLTSLTS